MFLKTLQNVVTITKNGLEGNINRLMKLLDLLHLHRHLQPTLY
jgi:hypothetical protein